MACTCKAGNTVVDSRPHELGIRRRRRCDGCGARWTTLEVEVPERSLVVNKSKLNRRIVDLELGKRAAWRKEQSNVPTNAHPAIQFFFEEKNRQNASFHSIYARSGVASETQRGWNNRGRSASIQNVEAVLNTLGYTLTVTKKEDEQCIRAA